MNLWTWWASIPATVREPIRSYAVSTLLALQSTVQTAFSIGYGLGLCSTADATWHYFTTPAVWFGILVGVFGGVGPYYRLNQGRVAAANTYTLPSGARAVITKGP